MEKLLVKKAIKIHQDATGKEGVQNSIQYLLYLAEIAQIGLNELCYQTISSLSDDVHANNRAFTLLFSLQPDFLQPLIQDLCATPNLPTSIANFLQTVQPYEQSEVDYLGERDIDQLITRQVGALSQGILPQKKWREQILNLATEYGEIAESTSKSSAKHKERNTKFNWSNCMITLGLDSLALRAELKDEGKILSLDKKGAAYLRKVLADYGFDKVQVIEFIKGVA